MPAQYGGRVSAVLDCKLKEGSTKNYNFSTGISPMTVILTADGPIIKDKSSFLVSARRSWLDSFVKLGTMVDMLPSFYDLNFKINTQVGEKKSHIFFIL
jgi:hypothetical protein